MVVFYERTPLATAKRHLLVDFHGAYKLKGWLRSFPNVMTSEGFYSNEQSKLSPTITHITIFPYIRMVAGKYEQYNQKTFHIETGRAYDARYKL